LGGLKWQVDERNWKSFVVETHIWLSLNHEKSFIPMSGNKTAISVVSYINTWPFLYGIEYFTEAKTVFEPRLDYPAECARKIIAREVPVGLLPVGGLLKITDYKIITDFCIGAGNHVCTVMIFSHSPLSKVKKLLLDYQSTTSVLLARILIEKYWQLEPEYEQLTPGTDVQNIPNDSAVLIIGDRCFDLQNKFSYATDLAKAWNDYTGLPFAFAVWVAGNEVSSETIGVLQNSLHWGLQNTDRAIEKYNNPKRLTDNDIKNYLTNCIQFELNAERQKAIEKFLTLSTTIKK
jgi:chorismate dehydratase